MIDGAVETVPLTDIPSGEWPGWEARYGGELEAGKRTARENLPEPIFGIIGSLVTPQWINFWCDQLGYAVLPDPLMWGGGLQVTDPGGSLAVHLDSDRQKKLPYWRRALSVVAFIHPEWDGSWDGHLTLCNPYGNKVEEFAPMPGRLVAFECSDISYHGVLKTLRTRVSIATAFLAPASERNTRVRSLFIPSRSE